MSKAPTFTGRDLAAFRERHGLSRPQLQEATGIHRNSANNWERDDEEIGLTYRLALAAFEAGLPPIARKGRARS